MLKQREESSSDIEASVFVAESQATSLSENPVLTVGPLSGLSSQEEEKLLDQLLKHGRKRRKLALASLILKWIFLPNTLIGFLLFAWNVIAAGGLGWLSVNWTDWSGIVSVHRIAGEIPEVTFGGAWVILVAVLSTSMLGVRRLSAKQARLSRNLPYIDDVRAVGPLLEAMTLGKPALSEEAARAVSPLLSRMRTSDADHLTWAHHEIMHKEFEKPVSSLKAPILEALEAIGKSQDVEVLEAIASGEKREIDPDLRERISQTVEAIKSRLARSFAHEKLLRPAEAVQPETLLRPAAGAAAADPATLLRSAE